jgi:hypothetical protein
VALAFDTFFNFAANPDMKKFLCLTFTTLCVTIAFGQRQGIGLRIGDPLGLTYKKYYNRGVQALEFGLGTTGAGWHQQYYRNSFKAIDRFDDFSYRSHIVQSTMYLQMRYLVNNKIVFQGMEGEWNWYWGFGLMMKTAKVRYTYADQSTPQVTASSSYVDVDFGPEGIIGMEYTFEDLPLSVFGETSLMLEVVNRFGFRPYGGAGIRYNF